MKQVAWVLDKSSPDGIRQCFAVRHDELGYTLEFRGLNGVTIALRREDKDVFFNKDEAIAMLHSFNVKSPKV